MNRKTPFTFRSEASFLVLRAGAAFALASSLLLSPAGAQNLMQGPDAAVTAEDVKAAAQRVPLASRAATFSKPENVRLQAEDLYVRRQLALEAERAGLDKNPVAAALIRQARERILSEAQLTELVLAALPSDEAATAYARDQYRSKPERFKTEEQTRASHILISRTEDGKAREKAEALLAQIKAGASFEKLAKEHSADLATAEQGGDLGWFSDGTMVDEFHKALAVLKKPGELAPIVETKFGFHIVRLQGRRPPGVRSFDEVRQDLEREVRAKAQADARKDKMRVLREAAQTDNAAIEALAQTFRKP